MINRRKFIQGCCAGIAAMNGVRVTNLAMGDVLSHSTSNQPILISLFLRGGMDGLSFLVPHGDPNYHEARQKLALKSEHLIDVDGYFGLNRAVESLHPFYLDGQLALINACGLPEVNRSHFDAQEIMERGARNLGGAPRTGWLARYLNQIQTDSFFSGITIGQNIATEQLGFDDALSVKNLNFFTLHGNSRQKGNFRQALKKMYYNGSEYETVVRRTLDLADFFDANRTEDYQPKHEAKYPDKDFGHTMKTIAQMIRLDLGVHAISVDMGGWDTHDYQANWNNPAEGYFTNHINQFSNALSAFWTDLSDFHDRITIVVMSEFGRRLKENNNIGTDHGHAGLMMVLDKNISQKKIWGNWPGLENDQLTQRADLRVTTDYRSVISEILKEKVKFQNTTSIFPNYQVENQLGLFTKPVNKI